jgi:excisionase family DNA binding protein
MTAHFGGRGFPRETYAMPDLIQPLAVSIEQACQCLGVGETTLRALLDNGRLPFSRVPGANPEGRGRVLIKVSDLNALLDATRVDVKCARPRRKAGRKAARS